MEYCLPVKWLRKKYPHVAAVYGMHEDNEGCTKPYLKSPSTLHSVNGEKPGGIRAITDKQEVGSNP